MQENRAISRDNLEMLVDAEIVRETKQDTTYTIHYSLFLYKITPILVGNNYVNVALKKKMLRYNQLGCFN